MRVLPSMLHYSVSKTAQISLAHGLARLTAGTGVTVNSVLAGPTWTEGVEKYIAGIAAKTGGCLLPLDRMILQVLQHWHVPPEGCCV